MAPYIVCNKCGMKGLKKYKMMLMHGKNGFRRYSVCEQCAKKLGLEVGKMSGGRQRKAEVRGEVSSHNI